MSNEKVTRAVVRDIIHRYDDGQIEFDEAVAELEVFARGEMRGRLAEKLVDAIAAALRQDEVRFFLVITFCGSVIALVIAACLTIAA